MWARNNRTVNPSPEVKLTAVHPAYDKLFDGFAPKEVHGNARARTEWAVQQLKNMGKSIPTPWTRRSCYIQWFVAMADDVSLAATTGWIG